MMTTLAAKEEGSFYTASNVGIHARDNLLKELTEVNKLWINETIYDHGWWWSVFMLSITLLVASITAYALIYLIRYRKSIKSKLHDIDQRLSRGIIIRDKNGGGKGASSSQQHERPKFLELYPEFVIESAQEVNGSWKLISLGEYLASLRLNTFDKGEGNDATNNLPKLIRRELEVTIGSALINHFGPLLGAALLPMIGTSVTKLETTLGLDKVTKTIASYVASRILTKDIMGGVKDNTDHNEDTEESQSYEEQMDQGTFPFSMAEIVSFMNLNQKFRQRPSSRAKPVRAKPSSSDADNDDDNLSSLEWLRRGEIGYTPSYHNNNHPDSTTATVDAYNDGIGGASDGGGAVVSDEKKEMDVQAASGGRGSSRSSKHASLLIPNPFIIEDHFNNAILGLERIVIDGLKKDSSNSSASSGEASAATTEISPNPNNTAPSSSSPAKPTANLDEDEASIPLYNPNDRSLPPPTPINESILPDLYMG